MKHIRIKSILFLLGIILLSISCAPRSTMKGRVHFIDKEPGESGARPIQLFLIKNNTEMFSYDRHTNDDGTFYFSTKHSGELTLQLASRDTFLTDLSYSGYMIMNEQINLDHGETLDLDDLYISNRFEISSTYGVTSDTFADTIFTWPSIAEADYYQVYVYIKSSDDEKFRRAIIYYTDKTSFSIATANEHTITFDTVLNGSGVMNNIPVFRERNELSGRHFKIRVFAEKIYNDDLIRQISESNDLVLNLEEDVL